MNCVFSPTSIRLFSSAQIHSISPATHKEYSIDLQFLRHSPPFEIGISIGGIRSCILTNKD